MGEAHLMVCFVLLMCVVNTIIVKLIYVLLYTLCLYFILRN